MYLDSAVIVKLSVPESDSGYYTALVDGLADLVASALSFPECRSALVRKLDSGEITPDGYSRACEVVEKMLSGNSGINVVDIDNDILRLASTAIERCRGKAVLRTLDAIHIATCMKTGSYPLVTNDKIMRKAADALEIPLTPLPQ